MNWYLAKIVFRIICGSGDHSPQFDEQLRLVAATTKEEAFSKARIIGRGEEETFTNKRNEQVRWQFINVCEIRTILELTDGVEIYSRIEEKDNAIAFIETVNRKADSIQPVKNQVHQYATHSML